MVGENGQQDRAQARKSATRNTASHIGIKSTGDFRAYSSTHGEKREYEGDQVNQAGVGY